MENQKVSERSEICVLPFMDCELCQYALKEEVGYNNHRTYCMLKESYVVETFKRKLGT